MAPVQRASSPLRAPFFVPDAGRNGTAAAGASVRCQAARRASMLGLVAICGVEDLGRLVAGRLPFAADEVSVGSANGSGEPAQHVGHGHSFIITELAVSHVMALRGIIRSGELSVLVAGVVRK